MIACEQQGQITLLYEHSFFHKPKLNLFSGLEPVIDTECLAVFSL